VGSGAKRQEQCDTSNPFRRFGVVDLYETSDSKELHSDNVHINKFFYGEITRLIFGKDAGV